MSGVVGVRWGNAVTRGWPCWVVVCAGRWAGYRLPHRACLRAGRLRGQEWAEPHPGGAPSVLLRLEGRGNTMQATTQQDYAPGGGAKLVYCYLMQHETSIRDNTTSPS